MKVYYGGAWHQPHGGYAPTFNPATNQPLVDAPIADAIDVDRAVDAAATAFRTWRATTPETRSAALRRVAAIIRDYIPELALIDAANSIGAFDNVTAAMVRITRAPAKLEPVGGLGNRLRRWFR